MLARQETLFSSSELFKSPAGAKFAPSVRHDPGAIGLTLGAPVVLVIIFGYIFGSAIQVPGGGNYREFLLPGLLATTAANILPSMVAMGFIDAVCPSIGIWTTFNQIAGPKEAVPMIDSPHNHQATDAQLRPYTERSEAWLAALRAGEPAPVRRLATP